MECSSVKADSDLDEFTVSFSNSFVSQRCLMEWLYSYKW